MDFRKLKIGYVPYLPDLSQPGDRRRFPYFAKRNNIPFEIADKNKEYDIILLTASGNLSKWLIYKRKHPGTKFIFEMVDSLIFSPNVFNTLFKGLGWFILRRETLLYPNYRGLIIKWLKSADIVLCASTELKKMIEQWNNNVIVSLDYMENEYRFVKTDFSIKNKLKLVWEGQGAVLPHFLSYKEILSKLSSFSELHIVTSEKYPLYGKIVNNHISKILKQLPITTVYHKWDLNNNYKIFSQCDCAIIPLNKKNLFGWHKPANKLISFWFTGLPTIVSATPAYKEIMDKASEGWYCSNNDEWVTKILMVKNMKPEEREFLAKKNQVFAQKNYSDVALDIIWQGVFKQITSDKA
ncbi:MAG: hypothetical protein ABI091_10540 [Ferruginibacter sp.]